MGLAKHNLIVDEQGQPVEVEVELYEEDFGPVQEETKKAMFLYDGLLNGNVLLAAQRRFIDTVLKRSGARVAKDKLSGAEMSDLYRLLVSAGFRPPGKHLPLDGK